MSNQPYQWVPLNDNIWRVNLLIAFVFSNSIQKKRSSNQCYRCNEFYRLVGYEVRKKLIRYPNEVNGFLFFTHLSLLCKIKPMTECAIFWCSNSRKRTIYFNSFVQVFDRDKTGSGSCWEKKNVFRNDFEQPFLASNPIKHNFDRNTNLWNTIMGWAGSDEKFDIEFLK